MAIETTVDVKPCPFCGTKEADLYVGAMSSLSYGVGCKCGAKMVVNMPNKHSRKDRLMMAELQEELHKRNPEATPYQLWDMVAHAMYTLQAIEKWNKRS